MLLLCDVSKREVSTQPKLPVLPHAYLMLVCSAFLSRGMVVLLVMTGCRLFHILMVLGKKDDLLHGLAFDVAALVGTSVADIYRLVLVPGIIWGLADVLLSIVSSNGIYSTQLHNWQYIGPYLNR